MGTFAMSGNGSEARKFKQIKTKYIKKVAACMVISIVSKKFSMVVYTQQIARCYKRS